jgi:hypothetical protein
MALFSLTLSAFVTSTAAWFAVSDFLQIRNIAISYDKQDFLIGVKEDGAIDYSSAVEINQEVKLTPVSSMYQALWYDPSNISDEVFPRFMSAYPNGRGAVHETSYATSGYFQIELYFSSSKDTFVFLDESTAVEANVAHNQAIAAETGESVEALNKIADCIRLSFYGELGYAIYEPNVDASSATPLAGRLDVDPSDGYYDFDAQGREILYGDYDYEGSSLAYETADPEGPISSGQATDGFDAISKPGIQALDLGKSSIVGLKTEKTYTLGDLVLGAAKEHPLLYIPAGGESRLVVSIYVEGWDRDCVNAVKDASFAANLVFAGRYEPYSAYGGTSSD